MSLLLSLCLLDTPAAAADPGWFLVMPFGVPQFTHGKPGRGVVYAGLQGALIGGAVWSSMEMLEAGLAGEVDRDLTFRLISAGFVAAASGAWLASAIDGSRLHQLEQLEGGDLSALHRSALSPARRTPTAAINPLLVAPEAAALQRPALALAPTGLALDLDLE